MNVPLLLHEYTPTASQLSKRWGQIFTPSSPTPFTPPLEPAMRASAYMPKHVMTSGHEEITWGLQSIARDDMKDPEMQ